MFRLNNNLKTRDIILPFILMAIPVILYFSYISFYGVNVLFWDEWELVPLFHKYYTENLNFSDLLSLHNEHRMLFPKLVFLFLGNLTHLNTITFMYFSASLLLLTLIVIFSSWIKFSGSNEESIWMFLPIPYLLFSLFQYENTLWGFQISLYMVLLFSVLSFTFLEKVVERTVFLIPAIISGFVASFSSIQGLLVWPIGGLFFLYSWKFDKENRVFWQRNGLFWAFSGLIVSSLYFVNYQKPLHHPSVLYGILHPIDGLMYFLSIIGAIVVPTSRGIGSYGAIFLGFLLFFIYCYFIRQAILLKDFSKFYLPFSLIFFSLLFDVITTFGRSGFGVEQAYSSRYTTYNILGLIGTYLLILTIIKVRKKETNTDVFILLKRIVILIIIIQIIFSQPVGYFAGEKIKNSHTEAKITLLNYETASKEIIERTLYPDPENVRGLAKICQKYNLSVFSDAAQI